jgi:FkbM family methyltransferase
MARSYQARRIRRPVRQPSAANIAYYSEYGEDQWIAEHLRLPASGFFVDIGAGDGVSGSNSLFFERLGWDGLLIEPDARNHSTIRRSRRAPLVDCAVGLDHERAFYLHSCPVLSGFLRTEGHAISVRTASLADVLEEHRVTRIDLLSIDTEGTELEVWQSFSAAKYSPRIVIAEWMTFGIAKDENELREAIENDGYRLLHRTTSNFVFVRNDIALVQS